MYPDVEPRTRESGEAEGAVERSVCTGTGGVDRRAVRSPSSLFHRCMFWADGRCEADRESEWMRGRMEREGARGGMEMRDGPHQRVGRGPRVMGHHDGHAPRMTCAGSDAVVACIDWVARVRLTKGVFSLLPKCVDTLSALSAREFLPQEELEKNASGV